MKTYILDTINRIKRFSESLDVQTSLCNKPWVVFNDSGDREVFIFNPDGSVIITVNGIGIKRTWQWITANKSLIINQPDDTIVMLHPEYFNNLVMALNRDGTQEYAFLIDDNNRENFTPKTLSELKTYFLAIEKKAIEEQLNEKQKLHEEEQRKAEEKHHSEMLSKVQTKFDPSEFGCITYIFISVLLIATLSYCIYFIFNDLETTSVVASFFGFIIIFSMILFALHINPKINAKKFIKKHPDDQLTPYIKEFYKIK